MPGKWRGKKRTPPRHASKEPHDAARPLGPGKVRGDGCGRCQRCIGQTDDARVRKRAVLKAPTEGTIPKFQNQCNSLSIRYLPPHGVDAFGGLPETCQADAEACSSRDHQHGAAPGLRPTQEMEDRGPGQEQARAVRT